MRRPPSLRPVQFALPGKLDVPAAGLQATSVGSMLPCPRGCQPTLRARPPVNATSPRQFARPPNNSAREPTVVPMPASQLHETLVFLLHLRGRIRER
nr:unnamed protein product [Digitaria exilis]